MVPGPFGGAIFQHYSFPVLVSTIFTTLTQTELELEMKKFLLLVVSIVSLCSGLPQQVVDLTGSSWTVADLGGTASVPATVPGQVHLDLL